MLCKCGSQLYCLDTRETKATDPKRSSSFTVQIRKRRYACADCHHRYISYEILHAKPVGKKPIPPSFWMKGNQAL